MFVCVCVKGGAWIDMCVSVGNGGGWGRCSGDLSGFEGAGSRRAWRVGLGGMAGKLWEGERGVCLWGGRLRFAGG